jgi:gluconokinase
MVATLAGAADTRGTRSRSVRGVRVESPRRVDDRRIDEGSVAPMAARDAAAQVIVMGVSGVGKSTVAKGLSTVLGWTYAEGDAFHSAANVARMASGEPLTDDDRWPWLRAIGAWLDEQIEAGSPSVVTCSALRRAYRDLLREGRPEVSFLHLGAGEDLVADRMSHRVDHYMPVSLLHSQYDTLEPLQPDEPGVSIPVDGTASEVLRRALAALGLSDLVIEHEGDPS